MKENRDESVNQNRYQNFLRDVFFSTSRFNVTGHGVRGNDADFFIDRFIGFMRAGSIVHIAEKVVHGLRVGQGATSARRSGIEVRGDRSGRAARGLATWIDCTDSSLFGTIEGCWPTPIAIEGDIRQHVD